MKSVEPMCEKRGTLDPRPIDDVLAVQCRDVVVVVTHTRSPKPRITWALPQELFLLSV